MFIALFLSFLCLNYDQYFSFRDATFICLTQVIDFK